ncbi:MULTISPECIES: hypothetical protein [Vibrio]|uniref:Uncharacterized protein n=1 Tax=Vibrio splendidus TaxID=29497 RepID=A0A2T5EJC9_VIBSP|nr:MULTISPECIES: hypothetical protein [Vibrio]EHY9845653.1 hypothetical protein [Vibrio cholerae]MCS0096531.1 hypothetical protein [Vibrio cholerae]OEE71726.1 hypothetical protein A147_12710 [Vibrio splendidus FF-6]PTP20354.1 hypothetical protein CWO36_07430 [Vibrio splendidus]
MSDFEKLKQLVLFLLFFVVIAPWVVLSEAMLAICISSIIIFPFLAIWFVDYRKFKKSDFKTYEQYWHYHHNMMN